MRDKFKWGRRGKRYKTAKKGFSEAAVQQFNNLYGMDKNDLPTLQNMFDVIGATNVPDKTSVGKKVSNGSLAIDNLLTCVF